MAHSHFGQQRGMAIYGWISSPLAPGPEGQKDIIMGQPIKGRCDSEGGWRASRDQGLNRWAIVPRGAVALQSRAEQRKGDH